MSSLGPMIDPCPHSPRITVPQIEDLKKKIEVMTVQIKTNTDIRAKSKEAVRFCRCCCCCCCCFATTRLRLHSVVLSS